MAKPRVDAPWGKCIPIVMDASARLNVGVAFFGAASFQASSRGGSSAAEPNVYFDGKSMP